MDSVHKGFTLIELMIVVAIVGILAAIALPPYQSYVIRSKVSEALAAMGACKTSIADYVSNRGSLPTDLTASGCANSTTQYVNGVDVTDGVVTVTLRSLTELGAASGATLTLTPAAVSANLSVTTWTCASAGGSPIPPKYLPGSCR
jgi:type IV pilus assembly protein PilA